jgi:hypothetical protein
MIDVHIDDFEFDPLAALNGATFPVPFAPIDIARGAVTVSRPVPRGTALRSLMDHASTALQILALLDDGVTAAGWSAAGPMTKSSLFAVLDPTEKANTSYRIGTGVAHLCTQDLLDVDQLGHLDRLIGAGQATLVAGDSRPDLVGQDTVGNWAVVEAKGRSNGVSPQDIELAKRQCENVAQVGDPLGAMGPPLWRVASMTDMAKTPIAVRFVDPPAPDDGKRTVIQVDPVGLLRGYYSLVAAAAEYTGPVQPLPGQPDVLGARLPGSTVWVGLAQPVRETLDGPDEGLRERLSATRPEMTERRAATETSGEEGRRTSIGPDGFVLHVEI